MIVWTAAIAGSSLPPRPLPGDASSFAKLSALASAASFGFLLALTANPVEPVELIGGKRRGRKPALRPPKPIAPFDGDYPKASAGAFDRETGEPVPSVALKSYRQALAQYHLRPESKFLNADFADRGATIRRHVHAIGIRHIGKEANRWEEQFFTG